MDKTNQNLLQKITEVCQKSLYSVGIFSFFINLFMLTVPIYMMQLYDRVLVSHSYETLIYLTLIAVTALIVMALVDMARSRILVHISNWLDNALGPTALTKSADEILQGRNYGSQSLRDITNIRQFLAGAGIFALFDAPWMPIYLIVIYLLHPTLGVLSILGALALFALGVLNEKVTRDILAEANSKAIASQQYIEGSLRNAEAIQAMGMMPNLVKHWQANNAPVLQLQTIASNRAGVILGISKFLRLLLQLLILGVGAVYVIQNELTMGVILAASILMSRALAPAEQAIGVWKQLLSARQAYQRLQKHFAEQSRYIMDIKLPSPKGELQVENVIYRASNVEKPIIYGISLQIKAGEMIALIGPSGAGKSTLARLISGVLKPTVGNVRLDNADVYAWERADFGRYIGYLPQDVELFLGSVKDNIARMGKADDAAVVAAAKLAGVHEMILHMPQGYDTIIGSGGGFSLSGGQRQRIALARALYQDPALLVLDEPNSNLDNDGEEALARTLLEMRNKGTTQIIITHRPSVVRHVDRIIVLSEGKIQLMGPRDQVMLQLQQAAQKQQGTST